MNRIAADLLIALRGLDPLDALRELYAARKIFVGDLQRLRRACANRPEQLDPRLHRHFLALVDAHNAITLEINRRLDDQPPLPAPLPAPAVKINRPSETPRVSESAHAQRRPRREPPADPIPPRLTKQKRARESWHYSLPDDRDLPMPVKEEPTTPTESHLLSEELDRRARAMLSWAPWARRARRSRSRRYEGFSRRSE